MSKPAIIIDTEQLMGLLESVQDKLDIVKVEQDAIIDECLGLMRDASLICAHVADAVEDHAIGQTSQQLRSIVRRLDAMVSEYSEHNGIQIDDDK